MATSSNYSSEWGRGGGRDERVPGARRQKLLGYVKAANELRQSYQSQLSTRLQGDEDRMPGDFPDVDIVRSGDEEMLLFPSYARKHIRRDSRQGPGSVRGIPGSQEELGRPGDNGDADYWRREWEKYEDDNAIVDVDVRGWIYSPQKGPLSRRNRLLIAVARKLSGIPAPESMSPDSRESSVAPDFRTRTHDSMATQEEIAAAREADMIAQHGQKEADAAWRGSYSNGSTNRNSPSASRSNSPSRPYVANEEPPNPSLNNRLSWNLATEMNKDELARANEQLMTRLRPFMTLPLANSTITIFFFNDQKSQSKTVTTDESGHFNLRAALSFVPTKVRVLASEDLSAVEEVIITESEGISLISDIDDTIKHSAIASGAKEIFKNTFIRDLGDLTIKGVKEWYSRVASMGVNLHYVSNSPWQLYPLLKSYFNMAGLPPGSFHLKQYSGMLQGIFEPAAERKKGSLERIMWDFPDRRFILVGDSGEADLEVYTDVVLANPGRILGVFIRDVTSPIKKRDFFDQTSSYGSRESDTASSSYQEDRESRPNLPTRPTPPPPPPSRKPKEEDLIDFDDEPVDAGSNNGNSSYVQDLRQLHLDNPTNGKTPNRPNKPSNLRGFSTTAGSSTPSDRSQSPNTSPVLETKRPPPPPKPRRPSTDVNTSSLRDGSQQARPPYSSSQRQFQSYQGRPTMGPRTPSSSTQASSYSMRDEEGYVASARRQIASAYNSLPALRSQSPTRDSSDGSTPPPMRRGLSSYPAAAARWATGASGGDPAAGGDGGAPGAPYDKKLEIWRRRWARAEEIMKSKGVLLKTWRVGEDAMDDCVKLIEQAQTHMRRGDR